jgi:tetratricopeptide (TPR) repeat protein
VIESSAQILESLYSLDLCSDNEALLARVRPPEDPVLREQVDSLRSEIDEVSAQRAAGRYREALSALNPLVDRARALGHPPLLAEALRAYGDLLDRNNELKLGESILEEAFVTAVACGHDEVMVTAASSLVWLLANHTTRWPEIDRWSTLGEAALIHLGGDARLAHALRTNVASSFRMRGELTRALELQNILLSDAKERTGDESQTYAGALLNRATTQWSLGQYKAASGDFERAHQLFGAIFGANHPKTISALNNRSMATGKAGDTQAAIAAMEQVVVARTALRGADDIEVADALGNLAALRLEAGNLDDARRDERRALEIREASLGPESVDVAWSLANLSLIEMAKGDLSAAAPLAHRALALFSATRGEGHLETAGAHLIVARLYRLQGQFKLAKAEITKTLQIHAALQASDHPNLIEPVIEAAAIEFGLQNSKQALANVERAAALAAQHAEASRERLGDLEFAHARALTRDRLHDALEHARKALDHYAALPPILGEVRRAEVQTWISTRQPAAKL